MKYIFSVAFLLFHFWIQAQSQLPAHSISFNSGVSVPLFDYAARNFHSGTYAQTGGFTTLNYTRYKKSIGWTLTIGGGNQKMNASGFNNDLKNAGVDAHTNDSSKWMSSIVMAGPSFASAHGKWLFEAAILSGFLFGKSPSMTLYSRTSMNDDAWKYYNVLWQCVAGIGFQTKGQISYQCSRHWAVSIGGSLYGGKLKFKTESVAVPENNIPSQIHYYPIKVSVFTGTLGLHYIIPAKKRA